MKTNKKELIEIVLIFVLGVIGILLIAVNVEQYNNKLTNTNSQTNYSHEF